MERRVFVIEAGKAFAVVAGALYLIGCESSTTSPSAVADISSTPASKKSGEQRIREDGTLKKFTIS